MPELWTNNARATLAAPVGLLDETVTLASGLGARFPAPSTLDHFWAALEQGPASAPTAREIVRVTGRTADVLDVTRGQQGTAPAEFDPGDRFELRLTAATLEALRDHLGPLSQRPRGFYGYAETATLRSWGLLNALTVANVVTAPPALATTSQKAGTPRIHFTRSGGAGDLGARSPGPIRVWRGNAARLGGFDFIWRVGLTTNGTTERLLIGLHDDAAAFPLASGDPSGLTTRAFLGLAFDAASGPTDPLRFMHSSGGGTVTNLSTGIARNSTSVFVLRIRALPNASGILVSLLDVPSGLSWSATLTTNIPSATTFLYPLMSMRTTTVTACTFDVVDWYIF